MRQAAWRSPWKGPHETTVTSWCHHMPLGASNLPADMSPLQWALAPVEQEEVAGGPLKMWCLRSQLFEYESINDPTRFGSLRCEPLPCYCS